MLNLKAAGPPMVLTFPDDYDVLVMQSMDGSKFGSTMVALDVDLLNKYEDQTGEIFDKYEDQTEEGKGSNYDELTHQFYKAEKVT